MFKRVLVGVDGKAGGRDAIALALKLTDSDGKLTLTHVHTADLRPSHAISPGLVAQDREASHKLLEQERAAADIEARLISVVSMTPGRGLHEQAEEQNADLIVVGSCSHSVFGRAMLGDDTRAALNGSPCAVAVAPLGYADGQAPITKVGVAYNSSPESEAALMVARELAAQTGASVRALEVVSIPSAAYAGMVPLPIGETMDGMLQQANSRMSELPSVEGRAIYGLAAEELAAFGDQLDLLVVGSRGYGPVKRLVLGSTSNHLARHARCPLLVLPRGATSSTEDSTNSTELQAQTPISATA